MILVRHERHRQILEKILEEGGLVANFINSKFSAATRSAKLVEFAAGKIDALIDSAILGLEAMFLM